jgi:hypothetical protein
MIFFIGFGILRSGAGMIWIWSPAAGFGFSRISTTSFYRTSI